MQTLSYGFLYLATEVAELKEVEAAVETGTFKAIYTP